MFPLPKKLTQFFSNHFFADNKQNLTSQIILNTRDCLISASALHNKILSNKINSIREVATKWINKHRIIFFVDYCFSGS